MDEKSTVTTCRGGETFFFLIGSSAAGALTGLQFVSHPRSLQTRERKATHARDTSFRRYADPFVHFARLLLFGAAGKKI
jgi:hypothetical protein